MQIVQHQQRSQTWASWVGCVEGLDLCVEARSSPHRTQPGPPCAAARLQAPACYWVLPKDWHCLGLNLNMLTQ